MPKPFLYPCVYFFGDFGSSSMHSSEYEKEFLQLDISLADGEQVTGAMAIINTGDVNNGEYYTIAPC